MVGSNSRSKSKTIIEMKETKLDVTEMIQNSRSKRSSTRKLALEEEHDTDAEYVPEIEQSIDNEFPLIDATGEIESNQTAVIIKDVDLDSTDQPKKRGRPKGSKNSTNIKKPKTVKVQKTPTPKLEKPKIVRVSKHLTSVKDKLVKIYGENKDKLLGLAIQKDTFETAVFDFDESSLIPFDIHYEDVTRNFALSEFSVVDISREELDVLVPLNDEEIRFDIGSEKFTLLKNETTEFPVFKSGKRRGLVFNAGGFVSDMAWTKIPDSQLQYLALSISNDNKAADPNLRLSGKPVPHSALINIYEFDILTGKLSLYYQLAHDFGLCWDIKWHPGFFANPAYVGLLTGVFQDGSVKIIPVAKSKSLKIQHLQKPSMSISSPESEITSFDFMDSDTICCGFQNGYFGQFKIQNSKLFKYKQVFESYIISTVVLRSNYENTLVCVSSVDGNCCIFDPKDIRLTKNFCTRTRGSNTLPLVYIPQLYTVVRTDSLSSVKAFTPRAIFVDHNICQHDNTVISLASSSLHPMLLSGSSDGSLLLNNIVRRMLQGLKSNTDIYRYIRLWKWDYSESNNTYRLDANYQVYKFSNTETSNTRINHPALNIQSVKWIDTQKCGKWYAFANSAGFIVIEKLGG